MATIANYFEQAQLSLAAYALDFQPGMSGSNQTSAYIDKLVFAGMSQKQAEVFADTYTVVDQFTDPVTGFSATVFDKAGVKYFAIRGTEGFFSFAGAVDWLANVENVSAEGVAIRQGLALFNYLQRLQGAANTPVVQYSYNFATRTMETYTGTANGLLSGEQVSVTGHSLGGHLAMMMNRLAPGMVNAVYTYNAPGFDTLLGRTLFPLTSEGFFNALRNAPIGPITGAIGVGWNTEIMTHWNVQGDVVHDIGNTPGIQGVIFSESANQGVVDAHDIKAITDSLAVYDLFAKLDPTFNTTDPAVGIGKITDTLKAASSQSSDTLERTVNALVNFLGLNFAPLAGTLIDDREELYKRVVPLQTVITGLTANSTMTVDVLTTATATGLANLAQGSEALAYRYALKELNPFAILGNNELYTPHNLAGELNLYDATKDTGLTDQWLEARSKFLATIIRYNTADGALSNDEIGGYFEDQRLGIKTRTTVGDLPRYIFADDTNPRKIVAFSGDDVLFGGSGNDLITTGAGINYAEGGTGKDNITGGSGVDTLLGRHGDDVIAGGGGNDILAGGFDNDVLRGGTGNDVYRIGRNDGTDHIIDYAGFLAEGDGLGSIEYDGRMLGGTVTLLDSNDPKVFTDGTLRYRYTGQQGSRGILTITDPGSTGAAIVLDNYRSGELGITLNFQAPPPKTDEFGDENANFLETLTGGFVKLFGLGGPDRLHVASTQSEGHGGLGKDILTNDDGDQYLYGDEDDDILIASGGNDELYGGTENDALQGGTDDDYLIGDEGTDVAAGGAGSDVVNGSDGADRLIGQDDADTIFGGTGDDQLIGDIFGIDPGQETYVAPENHGDSSLFVLGANSSRHAVLYAQRIGGQS